MSGRHVFRLVVCVLCLAAVPAWSDEQPVVDGSLVLWLDASDINGNGDITDNPQEGVPIGDVDSGTSWVDKSGYENHASGAGARRPTYRRAAIGGRPGVHFRQSVLRAADSPSLDIGAKGITVFLVGQYASNGKQNDSLLDKRNATEPYRGYTLYTRGPLLRSQVNSQRLVDYAASAPELSSNTARLLIWQNNRKSTLYWIDGRELARGEAQSGDVANDADLLIGNDIFGVPFEGHIGEILIYNRALSAGEMNINASYLAEKYRLNLTPLPLPSLFETDVLPIFQQHCHKCHGADDQQADLDLRTVSSMLRGGESGPAITRGHADLSLLVEMINQGEMPPDDESQLNQDEIALIAGWIDEGSPAREKIVLPTFQTTIDEEDRRHWAFDRLVKRDPPRVQQAERTRSSIDAFVLAKLEEKGLAFSPDVDRVKLARRVYFDLIGLPPSPTEIDAFVADRRPNAYERLVDRLLASPHFGERWGRHWLDIVGHTDTMGYDGDPGTRHGFHHVKWRYRDYVVRCFNEDKPYDQFLIEQLAGDELQDWRNASKYTPETIKHLIATGFWRTSEFNEENLPLRRYISTFDTVQLLGTSLLGLTLHCARCHSHKYEPISQQDYYQLMALITPAYNPDDWKIPPERAIPDVSEAERAVIERHNGEIDKKVADAKQQIADMRRAYERTLRDAKLADVPESLRRNIHISIETSADNRDENQKYLVDKFGEQGKVESKEVDEALSQTDRETIDALIREFEQLNSTRRSFNKINALYDVGPPPITRLLRRGNYLTPGREVTPGFLTVLTNERTEQYLRQDAPDAASSGRRSALARWLTEPNSPASGLVARVMANRIWQFLMGQGIAETSENLGKSGSEPTHPELLDYLAGQFIENDWSIQTLINQIMVSTVYRQASRREGPVASPEVDPARVDPGNQLLWRARLRRLESENIRDAILQISGDLDRTMGGTPVLLDYHSNRMVVIRENALPTPSHRWRRSIYLVNRRLYNLTLLSSFDQPIVQGSVCRRDASAVVLQSLTMMNDEVVLEQADHFANRVAQEAGDSVDHQIQRAFRLALGRRPDADEQQWSRQLVAHQTKLYKECGSPPAKPAIKGMAHLCRVLMNTSEFLYLE